MSVRDFRMKVSMSEEDLKNAIAGSSSHFVPPMKLERTGVKRTIYFHEKALTEPTGFSPVVESVALQFILQDV